MPQPSHPRVRDRHDERNVNGFCPQKARYLIIDDLISSGNTVRHMHKTIVAEHAKEVQNKFLVPSMNPAPVCAGILLYKDSGWSGAIYDQDLSEYSTSVDYVPNYVKVYDLHKAFPTLILPQNP